MGPPVNSTYIVQGEMHVVVNAMKRGIKWSSHGYQEVNDPLVRSLMDLKEILNHVTDFSDLEPNQFLGPFLEVIRSGDTTGPVTGLALSSVNKFLTYGLIDSNCETASTAVENITDAVTHARFVGTDPGSDEVVLMKILTVLRTLMLSPVGVLLSNESFCEIMQSCFRICFEMRLSELLRKSAESALVDMAQLLFARLPHFKDDSGNGTSMRKLKMRTGAMMDTSRTKTKRKSPKPKHKKYLKVAPASGSTLMPPQNIDDQQQQPALIAPPDSDPAALAITNPMWDASAVALLAEAADGGNVDNNSSSIMPDDNAVVNTTGVVDMQENLQAVGELVGDVMEELVTSPASLASSSLNESDGEVATAPPDGDYVNPRGVRFTPQQQAGDGPLIPYGLPCIGELFRFLVSLINPLDKQNTEVMIHIGLSLLNVSLETNANHIGNFPSILTLVKDELCRNLFFLLNSERFSLFVASLRVCFLLFEALRSHLKFQLEMYLNKLMAIIVSESPKVLYEQRETVLDSLVQLWCIPGFVTELYLNYDCDLHCSNLFEELTKLLSKNAFPVSGLFSTHLLSLDALLTVIDGIENHCHAKVLRDRQQSDRLPFSSEISNSNKEYDCRMEVLDTSSSDLTSHLPKASGYLLAQSLFGSEDLIAAKCLAEQDRCRRALTYENAPSFAELVNIKHKKKLLLSGTDQFNAKPVKGILFLQENGMLSSSADPSEIAHFLKENPRLDKKMIGEYISNRKNLKILESFVKSFSFEDTRVDEALRMYLETFRLPGEAPVISLLMEHFAEHWHKSNGEPFVNSDAAFTLAYAVIMLNVDQHNNNAKKQSIPMTLEDFKKNLSRVNGGQDFDADMLEEVYIAIKSEEIVMPAEQTGIVRENYLWKMLLRRGLTKDGVFIHAPSGQFDRNLFALIWGPTVAALSFVFDKSTDDAVVQRTISGFRKCAMIAAHYGMSDVFDHLMISLCKFTTLLNNQESPETIPITFGGNAKAQLVAKTVFNLAHRHGDILREGWRNVLDCLLLLYNARLLPEALVVVEDFVDPSGSISLLRRRDAEAPTASQRSETGLFSSFYSYITLNNTDLQAPRGLTLEDEECTERAQACILSCHPEHLVSESKFLRADSLQELVKALIYASTGPDSHASHGGSAYNEDATVFFLELLVNIVLHNRDRVNVVWQVVRDHIYGLMMGGSATEHVFLVERSVVSILRLAVRLLWREDMTAQVLQSLKMLLVLKPSALVRVARQITFALYELFKNNAANIHAAHDWNTLFTLLEYAGAGARPPRILDGITLPLADSNDSASENGVQSDSETNPGAAGRDSMRSPDRGYTSDSELYELQHASQKRDDQLAAQSGQVGQVEGGDAGSSKEVDGLLQRTPVPVATVNQYDIVLRKDFVHHDTPAFLKACESLAFLVRDAAHITSENFESCVHCIRTFTEASLHGGVGRQVSSSSTPMKTATSSFKHQKGGAGGANASPVAKDRRTHRRRKEADADQSSSSRLQRSTSTGAVASSSSSSSAAATMHSDDATDEEIRKIEGSYHQVSVQLLDLMHTLHTRAAAILTAWVDDVSGMEDTGALWSRCWCPLLQGIARLCCDSRRQVRTTAVTYLQRALLVHDLQTLSALEWEACFNKILFPLLMKLLDNLSSNDPTGVEETRVRGATLLCKVFLQHLTPLLSLSTFTALWLTILDFMDKYMHADKSDLLCEAIPESLKNMLLVMDTAGIFGTPNGSSQLWTITWDRIDAFLPSLKDEVFKSHQRDGVVGPASAAEVASNCEQPASTAPAACVIDIDEIQNVSSASPEVAAKEAADVPSTMSLILQPPPCSTNVGLQTIPLIVNTSGIIRDDSSQTIPIVFAESEIVSVMKN